MPQHGFRATAVRDGYAGLGMVSVRLWYIHSEVSTLWFRSSTSRLRYGYGTVSGRSRYTVFVRVFATNTVKYVTVSVQYGAVAVRLRYGYRTVTLRLRDGFGTFLVRLRYGYGAVTVKCTVQLRRGCFTDTVRVQYGTSTAVCKLRYGTLTKRLFYSGGATAVVSFSTESAVLAGSLCVVCRLRVTIWPPFWSFFSFFFFCSFGSDSL